MMSHVTWDLEVNLPIVPTSQCVSRVQIPGRCAPRHLLGCCHHCEPRPQGCPGDKSLFPQKSSQCCSGAHRMEPTVPALWAAAPDGAVNVHKGLGPQSCWACPQQLQGKGLRCAQALEQWKEQSISGHLSIFLAFYNTKVLIFDII